MALVTQHEITAYVSAFTLLNQFQIILLALCVRTESLHVVTDAVIDRSNLTLRDKNRSNSLVKMVLSLFTLYKLNDAWNTGTNTRSFIGTRNASLVALGRLIYDEPSCQHPIAHPVAADTICISVTFGFVEQAWWTLRPIYFQLQNKLPTEAPYLCPILYICAQF